jgi:hypothetical protein
VFESPTDRNVSFERDGLDTSKACHISAREMCEAVLQGVEAPGLKRKIVEVLSAGALILASIKRSAESSG